MVTGNAAKKNNYSVLQAKIRRPASRFAGIHQFRAGFEGSDYFSVYRAIFPHKTSLTDYHGSAFPKSANQILGNKSSKQPVSAYREILWSIARCQLFANQLREFSIARESFEQAVLQNNFSTAQELLNSIESNFGKSIWLYQNRIASAHISPRDSAPAEIAANLLEEVSANSVLHAIIFYIRRRIDSATLRDKLRSELSEKIQSTLYLNYFSAKILDVTDSSESAVSSLLFLDSQASIIDHYTSLVLVLQAAASDKMLTSDMLALILPALSRLFEGTQDRRLLGVLNTSGKCIVDASKRISDRAAVIEAYTEEQFDLCMLRATNVLNEDPLDSAIRLLYVKAQVATGKQDQQFLGLCGDIHAHLFNVLSANEQFFSSAHALLVLADRFIDHQWMLYFRVAVWYEIGAEDETRTPSWMRDVYVRECYLSPFLALTLDEPFALRVLETLDKDIRFSRTVQLVREIIDCSSNTKTVASSRQAKYFARELLSKRLYKEAADFYKVAAKGEIGAAARLRSLGGQSLALMLDGKYQNALETVVGAYLESPHAPVLLPFQALLERLPDADEWPNTIYLGLMLSLAGQLNAEEDMSKLRLAFEKFCEENSILTPTDLADRSEEFGMTNVIAYLDIVWQPEVMSQTLLYMSAEQIVVARIEACQVLAKIDTQRMRVHKEELASRIKQQEISKTTDLVERSKVHVDIEAIKRALKTKLKTSYAQYKSSISQHGKQPSELLDTIQSVFEGIDGNTSLPTLLSSVHLLDNNESITQSDIQFSSLFAEITKEFLTGDHGLNAYLSTRVRHGKFVEAIRKSVSDEHLVTARHEDGTYLPNLYWSEVLKEVVSVDKVVMALQVFAVNFDTTLFFVRDKKIQIVTYYDLKGLHEQSDGLFKYQFSFLERRLMQSYDADFKDFDELIVKCVDTLWEKTDANLASVRDYLFTSLRSELIKLFDDLSLQITQICEGGVPSVLSNAIARSRTATQQALDSVVAWFKRSEVYDRQDFDVDFPGQIAANMVSRTLSVPHDWSGPTYTFKADSKLPGRTLDALVDIFYALFENAVKYSELESVPLNTAVSISYTQGELRAEVASKALRPTAERLENLQTLRLSLATQESRRLAQSEGRSGFRKILMALSSPLYKNPFLEFEHTNEGEFKVNFGFKISEPI